MSETLGSTPLRNPKQEKFAQLVAEGLSKREAFASAGYEGRNKGGPSRLYHQPGVEDRVNHVRDELAEQTPSNTTVTRGEVIYGLLRNAKLAEAGVPVMDKYSKFIMVPSGRKDHLGFDVMEKLVRYDHAAITRVWEVMGKSIGMFVDVIREENFDDLLNGMDVSSLQELVGQLKHGIDPNLQKMQEARAIAADAELVEQPEPDTGTLQ